MKRNKIKKENKIKIKRKCVPMYRYHSIPQVFAVICCCNLSSISGLMENTLHNVLERRKYWISWKVNPPNIPGAFIRLTEDWITSIFTILMIIEEAKDALKLEVNWPGKLLGYRVMQKKLTQEHELKVPRDKIDAVLYNVDREGLEVRSDVWSGKKKVKGTFATNGPNWVLPLDGHDNRMGYYNSACQLAIYGCLGTANTKIMWLRIWTSNSDRNLIGRWYLEHIYDTNVIASYLRSDKGTETDNGHDQGIPASAVQLSWWSIWHCSL